MGRTDHASHSGLRLASKTSSIKTFLVPDIRDGDKVVHVRSRSMNSIRYDAAARSCGLRASAEVGLKCNDAGEAGGRYANVTRGRHEPGHARKS